MKDAAVAATCETTGKTEGSHCSVCNTVIKAQTAVAALGHSWDNGKVTKAATCTTAGTKTYTCTHCKKTRTETIAATGHKAVKDAAVVATCETAGKTEGSHCSVCGTVLKAQTTTAALGHDYGEWKTIKAATYTEPGQAERVCRRNASHKEYCQLPILEKAKIALSACSIQLSEQTIIETGLDISNVNTMIIHDSDRYGLSQLYQLRGRVGRSNRTAYAFLMYTKNKMLQETAEKRLSAMREYSDLGSGFKIAMKDLELRGAGNLLGAQQHGHMNAVGYDLYCKMLSEAVKEAKGIRTMDDFETTIDLNIDAFIPDSYISNEFQKLDIYKRIAGIESQQEYDDMLEELIDRFGEPTKAVLNLLAIARLKALAHQGYVTEIKQLGKDVRITLYEKAKLDPAGILAIMAQYRRGLQFKADHEPKFILTPQGRLIEELMKFAGELAKLAEPLE